MYYGGKKIFPLIPRYCISYYVEIIMARVAPFEDHMERYEDWFVKNEFAYQSELNAVKALLPACGKGVEVGVGTGLFAAPLCIRFGVDPSMKMLVQAGKRGILAVKGVGEELPFTAGVFDFVLMVTTVCFLDNVLQAFCEVKRVLRPCGAFLVGFIDKESVVGRQYLKYKDQSIFYRMADFYSVDDVTGFMRGAGFSNFSFVQTIFHTLSEIRATESVKKGFGQGSFVVVKAHK